MKFDRQAITEAILNGDVDNLKTVLTALANYSPGPENIRPLAIPGAAMETAGLLGQLITPCWRSIHSAPNGVAATLLQDGFTLPDVLGVQAYTVDRFRARSLGVIANNPEVLLAHEARDGTITTLSTLVIAAALTNYTDTFTAQTVLPGERLLLYVDTTTGAGAAFDRLCFSARIGLALNRDRVPSRRVA